MFLLIKGNKKLSVLKEEGVSVHGVLKTEDIAILEMKKANQADKDNYHFVIPEPIAKTLLIIN